MSKSHVLVGMLIVLVGIQTTVYAASVSTRVRVLESKVYSHAKLIKQQSQETQRNTLELKKGLKDMESMKVQFERFLKQQASGDLEAKRKKQMADTRYAYP